MSEPKLTYRFAYDDYGNIVDFHNVTKEMREQTHFWCIGCGAEMVAALGQKRQYFRHKIEGNCSRETYLHKLGKRKIKEIFDKESKFWISYKCQHDCADKEKCEFYDLGYCLQTKTDKYNLKQFYDSCEEEQYIDGYVADVLLTSKENPRTPPTLIEIWVSHKCEQSKYESGLHIIEIRLRSENDVPYIKELLLDATIETPTSKKTSKVGLYNFKSCVVDSANSRLLNWASIFKNGRIKTEYNILNCRGFQGKKFSTSLAECSYVFKRATSFCPYLDLYFERNGYNVNKSCSYCRFLRSFYFDGDMCSVTRPWRKIMRNWNPKCSHFQWSDLVLEEYKNIEQQKLLIIKQITL